jgi:chromosome segregation ATPase
LRPLFCSHSYIKDWIEELFEKSELRDKHVILANKEKEEAIAQSKSLAAEMSKTKQILEFTIGEKEEATSRMRAMKTEIDALKYCVNVDNSAAEGANLLKNEITALERDISAIKSERDELAALNDELRNKGSNDTNKIIELQHEIHMLKTNQRAYNTDVVQIVKLKEVNEELQAQVGQLTRQVQSHREACCEYKNEKRVLVERIEMAESELSSAKSKLQAKSEELDDNVFSFESERSAMFKDIAKLREQIKASYSHEDEKRLLVERAEEAEDELSRVRSALQIKSQALDDAVHRYESEKENMMEDISMLRNRAKELSSRIPLFSTDQNNNEVKRLKEENTKLISEQSYFRRLLERNSKVDDELRLMRLQLKTAQQNLVECDSELKAKEERLNLYERESHELRVKVESAQQRAVKAEKAIVDSDCERVNSREQANQTLRQLRQTQKELSSLKQANLTLQKRDSELRESVSRVRELVDGLASENANLKEKNENYCRMLSERENRGRELENLFKSVMAERDAAVLETKQSKASLLRLKESKEKMQCRIDSLTKAKEIALIDKERMSVRLDKMAGMPLLS